MNSPNPLTLLPPQHSSPELKFYDPLEKEVPNENIVSPNTNNNHDLNSYDQNKSVLDEEITLKNNETDKNNEIPLSVTTLIPLMKRFIFNLKKNTNFYRIHTLNDKMLSFINDFSYFSKHSNASNQTHKKKNITENMLNFLRTSIIAINAHFPVFDPYNKLIIFWDVIHFILIILILILNPIDICFNLEVENKIRVFLIFFFLVDMLITMNTKYFNKGFNVKKREIIIKNYLKNEFWPDLLGFFVIVLDMSTWGHWKLIKLLFVIRWKKLQKINYKLQEKFKIGIKIHASFIDLLNLLFISFYILNTFACVWYYIAYIYADEPNYNTWLNKYIEFSLVHQYLYSLYWSAVTIMTVGYGDISASNITELIFSIFTIIFGCGLFAYFINSIGLIIGDITKEAYLFKSKMTVINKYMEKKKIDHNLQMKIREYLRFIWQEESTQNSDIETEIINQLSKSLKAELIYEAYGQFLRKSPLFFANFSDKFLSELMYEIKEIRTTPEEIIFKQNRIEDCEIFFITRGKVELLYQTKGTIKILQEGESFGEIAFFTGNPRSCHAKSKDFTTLFSIKRQDFLKILTQNPEDYEKYCMIRDQIIFSDRTDFLQMKCFSCSSKEHVISNCPFVHYIPDRLKIIMRQLKNPEQAMRCPFERLRSQGNKFNSLYGRNYIEKCSLNFRAFSKNMEQEEEQDINESSCSEKEMQNPTSQSLSSKRKLKINTNLERNSDYPEVSPYLRKGRESSLVLKTKDEWVDPSNGKVINLFEMQDYSHPILERDEEDRNSESFCVKLDNLADFQVDMEQNELAPLKKQNTLRTDLNDLYIKSLTNIENDLEPPPKLLLTPLQLKGLKKKTKSRKFLFEPNFLPVMESNGSPHNVIMKRGSILSSEKNYSNLSLVHETSPSNVKKTTSTDSPFLKTMDMKSSLLSIDKDRYQEKTIPYLSSPINESKLRPTPHFQFVSNNLNQEFEKGVDFKNYNPDSNLSVTLQKHNKIRKKNEDKTLETIKHKTTNLQTYRTVVKIKTNKVIPHLPVVEPEASKMRIQSGLYEKSPKTSLQRKLSKFHSSIFSKRIQKFTKGPKFTFYDIVNEVLTNQELRKKLQSMKQKSLIKKKKMSVY